MAMVVEPQVIRTRHDLKMAVARCSEYGSFVLDVETDGLNVHENDVTWVGLATHGQAHLVPVGQINGRLIRSSRVVMELPPVEDRKWLEKSQRQSLQKKPVRKPAVFGDPGDQLSPARVFEELQPLLFSDMRKIGHNLKFDLMTVAKYYDGEVPPPPYDDTMIMQHVVDETRSSYNLKEIVLDFLFGKKQVHSEAERAFYPKLGKTIAQESLPDVARYLAKDVYLDWLLRQYLWRQIEADGLKSVYRLEMDVYPALMRMEMGGTAIDLSEMGRVRTDLEKQIDVIKQRCWKIAGGGFELTNVNKKRELLFSPKPIGQGLIPLSHTAKTNTPQLNQRTLEFYADRNELARLFSEWSTAAKLHSTYIEGLHKRLHIVDGVPYLHTTFTQHATVTGRTSSREPNIQNIPTESLIRGMFVAPDGYVLVVADYDQIELRVLAHFCKDPTMMGIFQRGEDIHAGTAAVVLGKDISEVTSVERTKIGKPLNFAVTYGAGWQKVKAMSGASEREARRFLDRYHEQFTHVIPWKQKVLRTARMIGDPAHRFSNPPYVTTLLGRRRRLPDLYDSDQGKRGYAERQAVNHRVQGTAAEIMKIAILKVDDLFRGTVWRMSMTVHDELHAVVPEEDAEAARTSVVETMSGICWANGDPIISVPLVVSCGTAKRWSEAKS